MGEVETVHATGAFRVRCDHPARDTGVVSGRQAMCALIPESVAERLRAAE